MRSLSIADLFPEDGNLLFHFIDLLHWHFWQKGLFSKNKSTLLIDNFRDFQFLLYVRVSLTEMLHDFRVVFFLVLIERCRGPVYCGSLVGP